MGAKKKPAPTPQYAPASRLHDLKVLLQTTGGLSLGEVIERLHISKSTALRYLKKLQEREPFVTEEHEGRMVYRILSSAQKESVQLTMMQILALFLSRRFFAVLSGTGINDDLEAAYEALAALLRKTDLQLAKNLDKKIYDVTLGRMRYDERVDDVDEAVTALLREETLRITHKSKRDGTTKTLDFDPYTLLFYRHALYLVGYSHEHDAIRTFAIDAIEEIERQKGVRFDYPSGYHPSKHLDGPWGIIRGPRERVRLRFHPEVAPYVARREWHPSQKIVKRPGGGLDLQLALDGTAELESWILSWGAKVEVIEPATLRATVADRARRCAAQYA